MRRNLMRRLCAILMVCAGFLYVVSAFGESISVGDFSYSYDMTTKEATLTKYNGSSEHITIPETFTVSETYRDEDDGEMHTRHHKITVTGIGSSVFQNKTFVASVSFHNKLKIIGNLAFYGCTSLASVSFLDSLTSIGYSAFFDCRSISGKLSLPNVKIIDFSAFSRCKGLTSVDFGAVVSIGGCAFSDCTSLTTVSFPETLKSIDDSAFSGCTSLSSLSFPETLKSIGDSAFRGCTSLSSLSFHNSLTTIGSEAFRNCISLKTFKTPSSLKLLDSRVLSGCTGLESAEIDGDGLHVGKSVFEYCTRLRSVVYGDGVSEIKGGIDTSGSSSLAPSTYSFANCTNLQCIVVKSTAVKSIPELFCNMPSLTTLSFAGTITNIGNYALCNCSGLVAIDATLRPVTIGHSAFSDCVNLNPSVDFSDCTSIGFSAFSGCWSMTGDLSLPKITDVPSRAFFCCRKITGVNLGSATTIGSEAFCGCWTLASVSFSDSLTTIGSWAFRYCYALASISFPNTLTSIGSYAFQGCRTLESFKTPSSLRVLDAKALMNCTGLESVQFGASLASIGSSAFYNCTNVSSFAFASAPPSVGSSAFSNVKKGAIGTYTAAHAAEWEAVIDSKGYWNGLKMKPSYYTVIYDANNGTGARTTATVEWGEPTPAGDGPFTWEAHYFMGWAIEDVGGSTLGSNDVIPEPQEGNAVILYAQWLAAPELLVSTASIPYDTMTLNWHHTDAPDEMVYSLYRNTSEDFSTATCLVSRVESSEGSYLEEDFMKITPQTSSLHYWIVAEDMSRGLSVPSHIEARRRFLLSVGYTAYRDWSVRNVPQTYEDATEFGRLCGSKGGFGGNRMQNPNTDSIRQKLRYLAGIVQPGDLFVFYISTHGRDSGLFSGAAITTYDSSYSVESLQEDIRKFPASVAVVNVIVTCHSAAMIGSDDKRFWIKKWFSECGFDQCLGNVAWITSCGVDQSTLVFSNLTQFGTFFIEHGFNEGYADKPIHGADYNGGNRDGKITLGELGRYANAFSIGVSDDEPSEVQLENEGLLDRIVIDESVANNLLSLPATPTDVSASQGLFDNKVSVSWTVEPNAKYYRLYRYPIGEPQSLTWVGLGINNGESGTKTMDDKLKGFDAVVRILPFAKYGYRVQAFNQVGYSELSEISLTSSGWRGSTDYQTFLLKGLSSLAGSPQATDNVTEDDYANLETSVAPNGFSFGASYIAGLDPTNAMSRFEAKIEVIDGQPHVTWKPDTPELRATRVYKTLGKQSLTVGEWIDITDEDQSAYRFFKVTVDLP